MALLNNNNYSNSSSSNIYTTARASTDSAKRSNTQASAYAVDASTMALTGFHFSTTSGAGGTFQSSLLRRMIFSTSYTVD